MISFSHVSLRKNNDSLLEDVSFEIEPGECISFLSTHGREGRDTLRLLAGFEKPSKGKVLIDGMNLSALSPELLTAYRRNIGYLEEQDFLLEELTIAQNIDLPLRIQKWKKEERAKRVAHLLSLGDLLYKASSTPSMLSESERRKVSFFRAIAPRPKILLLTNPPEDIGSLLKVLHEEGTTILFTSENADLPRKLGARTI